MSPAGSPAPLPAPASPPPPRLTRRALPPYRHVPGLTPHPVNHPLGHSFSAAEDTPAAPRVGPGADLPRGWRLCEPYLFGVDLFNRAYLWEAHEEWEELWHAAGHGTVPGRFLQGLIQVAAALLQRHLGGEQGGRERGVAYLLGRARRNLAPAEAEAAAGHYMGLAVTPWRRSAEAFLQGRGARYPFIVLAGEALPEDEPPHQEHQPEGEAEGQGHPGEEA